ncbi:MAG: lysostaphin resistance A-like protein [bacterium]
MPNRPGMNERSGLFILIALMGLGFMVGGGISFFAWRLMTGQEMIQMQVSMSNPAFVNEVRVLQTILSFFMFFIPGFLAAYILNKKPFQFLGFGKRLTWATAGLGMAIMIVSILLAGSLATLNDMLPISAELKSYFKGLEESYMKQVEVMSQMKGIPDLLITLLVMAAAPAVFEEVFFRGGFQNMMHRSTGNLWVSVIVTSILFSAIHFSFYGFFVRTALGLVLGLLYAYSKNLWMPIIAHFLNNAIGVVQVYMLRIKGEPIENAMGDKYPLWWGAIAIVIIVFLFTKYKQLISQQKQAI